MAKRKEKIVTLPPSILQGSQTWRSMDHCEVPPVEYYQKGDREELIENDGSGIGSREGSLATSAMALRSS